MSAEPSILYILGTLKRGGAQQQLYYLLNALRPRGAVLSLAPGGEWAAPIRELGYRVIELERGGSFEVRRLWDVMYTLDAEKPDIVHLFLDGMPGAYGRLATLIRRHQHVIVGIRSQPWRDPRWYLFLRRFLLTRHVQAVLCNSLSAQRYLLDVEKLPPHKAHYIPNGLQLECFAPSDSAERKHPLPGDWRDKVIVGMVGSLSPVKAPELLVQVAQRVLSQTDTVRFVHVGDGALRERVEALSRESGTAEHILFMGQRQDVPALLQAFDIFLMTSRAEGTPNAAMEAMAAGLPCVLTDVGDCRNLVAHGEMGYIVPPDDAGTLAEHVLRLANDEALRRRMGQAAYEHIQTYSVEHMAADYAALYRAVLAG